MPEEELIDRLKKEGYWDGLREMRKAGRSQEDILLWLRHEKDFPVGKKPLRELIKNHVDPEVGEDEVSDPGMDAVIEQYREFVTRLAYKGYTWHYIKSQLKLKKNYDVVGGDYTKARLWCNEMGFVLFKGKGIGELANDS